LRTPPPNPEVEGHPQPNPDAEGPGVPPLNPGAEGPRLSTATPKAGADTHPTGSHPFIPFRAEFWVS